MQKEDEAVHDASVSRSRAAPGGLGSAGWVWLGFHGAARVGDGAFRDGNLGIGALERGAGLRLCGRGAGERRLGAVQLRFGAPPLGELTRVPFFRFTFGACATFTVRLNAGAAYVGPG